MASVEGTLRRARGHRVGHSPLRRERRITAPGPPHRAKVVWRLLGRRIGSPDAAAFAWNRMTWLRQYEPVLAFGLPAACTSVERSIRRNGGKVPLLAGFPVVDEVAGPAGAAAPASRGEDMKTSTQKRIARLSGLLLLALLVVALAVPAAWAMRDFSTGTSGPSTSAGSGTSNAAQRPTQAQLQRVHSGPNGPSVASGAVRSTLSRVRSGWPGATSTPSFACRSRRPRPRPAHLQPPSGSSPWRSPESFSSAVGPCFAAAGSAREPPGL